MILINFPDRTLGLSFTYKRYGWSRDASIKVNHTLCTVAEVKNGKEIIVMSVGDAECNPVDQFVKERGRKWALSKALAQLTKDRKIGKAQRRQVWTEYFNRGKAKYMKERVH